MQRQATVVSRVALLKRDRPRWIDRYIDYFGEAALPPAPERRAPRTAVELALACRWSTPELLEDSSLRAS
jgi:hypothetical protein